MTKNNLLLILLVGLIGLSHCCTTESVQGAWDYKLAFSSDYNSYGKMNIEKQGGNYIGSLISIDQGNIKLDNIELNGNKLSSSLVIREKESILQGEFVGDTFSGSILANIDTFAINATRIIDNFSVENLPDVKYILAKSDLADYERDLDHATLITSFSEDNYQRGVRIYNAN
ncbi:MAG: hypothetical protein AAGE93_23230, partial [Bacteroidota bacterium]